MSNKLKFANDLDLDKKSQLTNAVLEIVPTPAEANELLIESGMICYVVGTGVYINNNGIVERVGDNPNTANVIYSETTPIGTAHALGALWFKPSVSILYVWNSTAWISTSINGIQNWTANTAYAPAAIVYYNNNLYRNNTSSIINTATFVSANWQNLTGVTIKHYQLLRSQAANSTVGQITLGDAYDYMIEHDLGNPRPNVVITEVSTNEQVEAQLIYTDDDNLVIKFTISLFEIGDDFNVTIS